MPHQGSSQWQRRIPEPNPLDKPKEDNQPFGFDLPEAKSTSESTGDYPQTSFPGMHPPKTQTLRHD